MKNYYILSNGRIKREANTLYIENAEGEKRPIPVEDVQSLYVYGEVDLNSRLLNFLSQKHIPLHVFNYYGFYAGSYYPRDCLHSGYLLVRQADHYSSHAHRMYLARELVRASAHSILRNVAYYSRRREGSQALTDEEHEPAGEVGVDTPGGVPQDIDTETAIDAAELIALPLEMEAADPLESLVDFTEEQAPLESLRQTIEALAGAIDAQPDVSSLMGIEGKVRERYYQSWQHILRGDWVFKRRVRRPPDNEINALISFGNGVLYTACLSEIYRTQLTPTISFLHEPGSRRFSLALDLSEIFKPLIVDRAIFRLVNTGQLTDDHFDKSLDGCYLNDAGKRLYLGALEARLASTIRHRRLGRHVSYRHLIRLECYKLIRHLTNVEPYRAFRAWW